MCSTFKKSLKIVLLFPLLILFGFAHLNGDLAIHSTDNGEHLFSSKFTYGLEKLDEDLSQTAEKTSLPLTEEEIPLGNQTVFFAILARNKGHLLPRYLKSIENLDYEKKLITIYINTNNNEDDTEEILQSWAKKNKNQYQKIIFEKHHIEEMPESNPHQWFKARFKILGEIRNHSLKLAWESGCDFYFVVDCDNFIAPCTLKTLVEKDKPIIAPLLYDIPRKNDFFLNGWFAVDENGYYKSHPDFWLCYYRIKIGTFKVPLVHCTYLVKTEYLDQLTYTDDTDDWEFIIFSRSARNHNIDQYFCNEKDFGVQFALGAKIPLEEEKRQVKPFLAIP